MIGEDFEMCCEVCAERLRVGKPVFRLPPSPRLLRPRKPATPPDKPNTVDERPGKDQTTKGQP